MKDLRSRVAVVTGAASGIGLSLSHRFAQARMKVVMADIEGPALEGAAAKVSQATGADVMSFVLDVSDGSQVQAMRDAVLARFGKAHVLCNNAGVSGRAAVIAKQTELDWKWVLGVNLWGVVHGVTTFLPDLIDQDEGHIVNTASVAGLVSLAGLGPYNVSKHAVVTLSETLYAELKAKGSGVGVSVLCPGAVNTRIHEAARNRPEQLQNQAKALTADQREQAKDARGQMGAVLAAGLSPDDVAEQVFAAIDARRFYILTHPEMNPLIEQRSREILGAKNPGTSG